MVEDEAVAEGEDGVGAGVDMGITKVLAPRIKLLRAKRKKRDQVLFISMLIFS